MARRKKNKTDALISLVSHENTISEGTEEAVVEETADDVELTANQDAPSEEELNQGTQEMLRPDQNEVIAEQPARPTRRRRSPKKAVEVLENPSEGIVTASVGQVELMVQHWEKIRGITETISDHLTRIGRDLQEISLHSPTPPAVIERTSSPKITLLNRITFGVSTVALVIALVVLSMAQSVREELSKKSSPLTDAGAQANLNSSESVGKSVSDRGEMATTFPQPKRSSELYRRYRENWRLRH